MKHALNALRVALALGLCLTANAHADGARTYQTVCAACHAQGVAGAPKTGDKKAWGKLIREGLVTISADGYGGVRGMPARGGQPDLSLPDFVSAVVHMGNQSGATWVEPDDETLRKIDARLQRRNAKKP